MSLFKRSKDEVVTRYELDALFYRIETLEKKVLDLEANLDFGGKDVRTAIDELLYVLPLGSIFNFVTSVAEFRMERGFVTKRQRDALANIYRIQMQEKGRV